MNQVFIIYWDYGRDLIGFFNEYKLKQVSEMCDFGEQSRLFKWHNMVHIGIFWRIERCYVLDELNP